MMPMMIIHRLMLIDIAVSSLEDIMAFVSVLDEDWTAERIREVAFLRLSAFSFNKSIFVFVLSSFVSSP